MKNTILALLAVNGLAGQLALGAMADPVDGSRTLTVHPSFPAYFQSPEGPPLLLIGDYTWGTFSDVDYDYAAMLDSLQAHGLNFARVWLWWGCEEFPGLTDRHVVMMDRRFVVPYQRIGPGATQDGQPKYDLSRFNPAFFDRLRKLCQAARVRGIHLQLILFDAWMLKHPHLWKLHAFQRDNNVNGVDADPANAGTGTDGERGFCSLGNPKALEAQQAYIRRVVDAVNECDNVLFEIANENFYNQQWELRLCDFIHDYEKTKPKRHLVLPKDLPNHKGVVQTWDSRRIHAALLEKRSLRQPLIFDTDWEINPNDDEVRRAMWAAVLSGGHFNYMDDSRQIGREHQGDYRGTRRASLHRQIGYLAAFMRQMRFWEMLPDDALVKAGNAFAMASTNELAAYLPTGGNVTLDLSKLTGQLEARWFDPKEGAWGAKFAVQGGRPETFTAPNGNDWALFLHNCTGSKGPSPPARVQATAPAPSSVRVIWAASTADSISPLMTVTCTTRPALPAGWKSPISTGPVSSSRSMTRPAPLTRPSSALRSPAPANGRPPPGRWQTAALPTGKTPGPISGCLSGRIVSRSTASNSCPNQCGNSQQTNAIALVGHCSVIVLAGTFTEVVQRFLNWNEQSKGVTVIKYVCGVLVILGGVWLIYSAP